MSGPQQATWLDFGRPPRLERLDNGLRVCVLENRQAPVITTALCYRVGARDEPEGNHGVAHFLEHMMFKGSAGFGPGEIDRHTQRLGGSNNAFTTHDATVYYFSFAGDRWRLALEIEADRMAGLTLDPDEVDSERDVILEELAMVRDDPWDALVEDVRACLYGPHPYGRTVLGDEAGLAATGPSDLSDFHRRYYCPENAVLVIAGDTSPRILEEVARCCGALEAGDPGSSEIARRTEVAGLRKVERRRGDVARLLLALPVPASSDDSYAALKMLSGLLGSGRTSRLHRDLVDERGLCSWVSVDVGETTEDGILTVAAEVVPGVEEERVQDRILAGIAELTREPVGEDELSRARRVLLADWVFGHERIHQQALALAWAATLFDPGFHSRQLEAALACGPDRLQAVAGMYLDPTREGVIGWSLPENGGR